MRKIRIFEHSSLDGVMEQEDGYAYGAWTTPYRTPAGFAMVLESYGDRLDLLLGRRTYDLWSGYWPKAGRGPMADRLNAATKYVVTHRPDSLAWGPARGLDGGWFEAVRALRETDGPDLVIAGSSTLTTRLLEQGLFDELVLIVYPVLLGRGKRYFSESVGARELAFVSSKATPTGVLLNAYRNVGALRM